MANYDIGTSVGHAKVTDTRTVSGVSGITNATATAAGKIAALRTALGASALSAYYTATQMNQMTRNDMVYALRVLNDPTGI